MINALARSFLRTKNILLLVMVCLMALSLLKGQSATSAPEEEFKIVSQAYEPQDPRAIRVQSTMVEVNVVVRDAKGKPISGLKREDFEVDDQGKPQTITSFNEEVAHPVVAPAPAVAEVAVVPPPPPAILPRYLGMYFDDQNMSAGQLVYVRKAAEAYVNKNMEETDRAAVFTSSETVTQQFTSNKQQILAALGKLLSHRRGDAVPGCPLITPYQAYEIELFFNEHNDATDLAISEAMACHTCAGAQDCERFVETRAATVLSLNENKATDTLGVLGDIIRYMGKMPGQRTLIMASAGFFSLGERVQHAQDKMIDAAIHGGITINTLDAKGLTAGFDPSDMSGGNGEQMMARQSGNGYAGMLADEEHEVSNDPMAAIAYGTGGKFFHDNNDLVGGVRQLAEAPEVSYVLGFSPEEIKDNGAFHNLKVKVPGQRDLSIAARPGYFALSKEEAAPGAKFQKLNKEVMGTDELSEIVAEVTTNSGVLATGEPALRVSVHVPGHSMQFKKENKRHNERIIFVTALFDMQDHYLAGSEVVMDMKLLDATHVNIARDGIDSKSTLQAPSGTYRLRQVVQEVVGGKLSAISRTVEIR
jgi:VWFA-related protein